MAPSSGAVWAKTWTAAVSPACHTTGKVSQALGDRECLGLEWLLSIVGVCKKMAPGLIADIRSIGTPSKPLERRWKKARNLGSVS